MMSLLLNLHMTLSFSKMELNIKIIKPYKLLQQIKLDQVLKIMI